ncbi:MAG: iron-containing alcohol dehydrogenase [Chromatiales bacterium]|nr:iron-containing alcohol dehydrogenase [Chromatiales bacterium]
MIAPFSIARLPRIEFGPGALGRLPEIVRRYGRRALFVTGRRSFVESERWMSLRTALRSAGVEVMQLGIGGEPSPEDVDAAVSEFADANMDVVVGLGGGSAMDAAKCIAGLLRVRRSVLDYLEGVGPELAYEGPAVPLVCVPTTAGTGSEATKNGVLSRSGPEGFKKSFRHDRLVAEYALVDPDLLASCPREVIAANGMDALTQVLESFVSTRANALTDDLNRGGLAAARDGLLPLFDSDGADAPARSAMAYCALISGITLAQTGLGSVHGLASPLGAFHPIPHGVVCGTLVAEAARVNLAALHDRAPDSPALTRYREAAEILCDTHFAGPDAAEAALVDLLAAWTRHLRLPGLGHHGVRTADIDRIVANARGSSMKTNPVVLSDHELHELVAARI